MEQIKILFFALASFFGIEDGRFGAEKTRVTIYPQNKEIEIIQEKVFTIVQSENDKKLALEQWDDLIHWDERNIDWSKELDGFSAKSVNLSDEKNTIQPRIILKYSNTKDLQAMGIWFDSEKNQFSINNIPENNMKTESGKLTGNYWNFDGDSTFSFTIEPFLQMPGNYQKFKTPLKELLTENKND